MTTLPLDLDELTSSIRDWLRELPPARRSRSGITRVVSVAGGPGLGKTAMCRRLGAVDASVAVLHLDGYLFPRAKRRPMNLFAFHLEGYDFARAARELRAFILAGQPIHIPPYLRTGVWGEPISIAPAPTVVLDGDLAELSPEIRSLLDARIFFIADIDTMHALRVDRDTSEGRFSLEEAEERWRVEWPALRDNVLTFQSGADLVVEPTIERRYRFRTAWPHDAEGDSPSGRSIAAAIGEQ